MARWKLFSRSTDERPIEEIILMGERQETITTEEKHETLENENLAEYHETLQADTMKKKGTKKKPADVTNQAIWRNVDSIEKKIDKIHITIAKKPKSDVDKKVDKLTYR